MQDSVQPLYQLISRRLPWLHSRKWLKEAKQFRKAKAEKNLCEWNARTLITYWGPDNKDTSLRDYSNREWSGLLQDYYLPRWKFFLDHLEWNMDGLEMPEINYFSFEKNWAEQRKIYPSTTKKDLMKTAKAAWGRLQKIKNATAIYY